MGPVSRSQIFKYILHKEKDTKTSNIQLRPSAPEPLNKFPLLTSDNPYRQMAEESLPFARARSHTNERSRRIDTSARSLAASNQLLGRARSSNLTCRNKPKRLGLPSKNLVIRRPITRQPILQNMKKPLARKATMEEENGCPLGSSPPRPRDIVLRPSPRTKMPANKLPDCFTSQKPTAGGLFKIKLNPLRRDLAKEESAFADLTSQQSSQQNLTYSEIEETKEDIFYQTPTFKNQCNPSCPSEDPS